VTGLTDEQRAVCAAVGVSEAAFLKASTSAPAAQLTAEQQATCRALGVPEANFLAAMERKEARS
jgi:phage I-like protein